MRLLVVDDEEFIRSLLGAVFREPGFDVRVATGAEALAQAAVLTPDAILLDVVMPGTDGWRVLAALRHDTRTARVPVIMMSAAGDPRHAQRARENGVLFVSKPFSLRAFVEIVKDLVTHPGGATGLTRPRGQA